MAAGERKANGKPKDIVKHYSASHTEHPVCKQKVIWYDTEDFNEVTCLKCRKKVIKDNIWYSGK